MLLMIDNYDSFTYNLVHYFEYLGQPVETYKNDQLSLESIHSLNPKYIVISPGPGNPSHAGISLGVIRHISSSVPTLGVCLGHQCIAEIFGTNIINAKNIMHGKTSTISHHKQGIFKNIDNHFTVTRYHSLVVDPDTLDNQLTVTAYSEDNEIMGIKHNVYPIEGVQFHPESIVTEHGYTLLQNFLEDYA